MNKWSLRNWTRAAAIAAMYVVLTWISSMAGLSSGAVQVRVSEALTVLPVFTASAIPGLTIGCILSNLLTGCAVWDVALGSLATLLGAVGTWLLRKKPALSPVPPIFFNTLIVPLVLSYVYGAPESIPYLMLTVGIGEALSCGVLGTVLRKAVAPHATRLFGKNG